MKKRGDGLKKFAVLLVAAFALCCTALVHAATDITDKVEVIKGVLGYDRLTKQGYLNVSVKNISSAPLLTPLKVVVDRVAPSTVSVANGDGTTAEGKSYFLYSTDDGQLAPGVGTAVKRWNFSNPRAARFTYGLHVEAKDNTPPVAQAGPDQTVYVSDTVLLDGSGSTDADGNSLTFSWLLLVKPQGSHAVLDNPTAVTPSFKIDRPGTYTVQLVTNDGVADSLPDMVSISTENSKPVADAGPDQTALVNDTVGLDGSGSKDIDGDPFTYQWTITDRPAGSITELSDPVSVNPALLIDKPGNYKIELIVNDGVAASKSDITIVSTRNSAPVANAGPAQNAFIGQTVTLDGSLSTDADGDPLTYFWSFTTVPDGSSAYLMDPATVFPSFEPDAGGIYVSQLIVNDGTVNSAPVTTAITVTLPECLPGAEQLCYSGPAGTEGIGICQTGTKTCGADGNFGPCLGQTLPAVEIPNNTIDEDCNGSDAECLPGATSSCYTGTAGTQGVGACKSGLSLCGADGQYGVCTGEVLPGTEIADNGIDEDCDGQDLSSGPQLPPDPVDVAPPVDTSVATTVADSVEFLYTGSEPIQTGVASGTIEAKRASVVRGRILDSNNQPLPGVVVSILHHPEFGQTLSRADGGYDLVLNGGGPLTLYYYSGQGYLFAQRTVNVPWQDFVVAEDVIMLAKDPQVTSINLTSNEPIQVAQGSVVSDNSGTRTALVMVPQGTQAQVILPDGSTQPVANLNIRITEYTVGEDGPKRMPAPLPPTSGYTYAVELSADESIAKVAGRDVLFSQPVPFYVDNFLNMPIGIQVPTAYYDNDKAAWIPVDDGKVIKILSITNGMADLDTNGDGVADSATVLSTLGINDAERTQLATLHTPGKSLWRVRLTHFSTYDLNYGVGPAPGSTPPSQPAPKRDDKPDDPCRAGGSIVECQSQVLGESIAVAGTPFTLNYRSDRVPGRAAGNTLSIPLSGATVPAPLKRIDLEIKVAGRTFTQSFPPNPNQSYAFTWDGKDAFDRAVQGQQSATVRIGYVYNGFYNMPPSMARSFGAASGTPIPGNIPARQDATLWQEQLFDIGTWDARGQGLGGWTMDIHHSYDPIGRSLYKGDGSRHGGMLAAGHMIETYAGNGIATFSGDGVLASQSSLNWPRAAAVGPDGSLFITDHGNIRIRRVSPDGIITTFAGNGTAGFSGDGGQATQARLNGPYGIAVGLDGSVFFSDVGNSRIRKVGTDGIISTIAGNGTAGFSGDGGPATQASLNSPYNIAIGPDGSIYIAEYGNHRIRRVGPDGIISTVAGNGTAGFSGDGGPAIQARMLNCFAVAVGPDGTIYSAGYTENRIRKISPDGIITTFAGSSSSGNSGDGGLASQARFYRPEGLAVGSDGVVYIVDSYNDQIRRVGTDGIITTIVGRKIESYSGDGGPPTQAHLFHPENVAVGQDGSLFIVDYRNYRIRKVSPFMKGFSNSDLAVPSQDGRELYHFNSNGLHLRTLHAQTGATLFQFGYNGEGHLISITDADGNNTTVERDANGNPLAIIAPFGQRTALTLDTNRFLVSASNPANEVYGMTYTADGLLTEFKDPRGNLSAIQYDAYGRLVTDLGANGGSQNLVRTDLPLGYEVSRTTGENRVTTYRIETLTTGVQKSTNIFPDGTQNVSLSGTDGSIQTTFADGTVTNLLQGPDPRFGMQVPISKSLTTSTGGRTSTMTSTRTANLTDPKNPMSLTRLTDTATINGRTSTSVFDVPTMTVTNTSAAGRQSKIILDGVGRVTQTQVTGILPINSIYDAQGRVDSVIQGTGADERELSFAYDAQGYLQTITDPLGRTLGFEYDATGRILKEILPDNGEVKYTYDANGNQASITPPGRPAHVFLYTNTDQVSAYEPPDLGAAGGDNTLYEYNLDKDLTRITRPDGQIINFSYNSAGKLTEQALPNGNLAYTYNATTGKLTGITDADGGGLAFAYSGSLLTNTAWTGAVTGSVGFGYDNDFRVTSISVNGGNSIAYQYDADSLLTAAGSLSLGRSAQNGLLTSSTLGTVADSFAYNGFGELSTYEARVSGASLLKTDFTHDKLGRIVAKVETRGADVKTYDYGYDLAGRLTEVKLNGSVVSTYTYDDNGNRLSYVKGAATTNGTYDDQDRLLTYGDATYTYTANGELASKTVGGAVTTYKYDVLGNLRQVTQPNGQVITYVIDGSNRRIGKRVNGTLVQRFLYQDQLKPIAELNGSGTIVSRFVYATRANVPDYMVKGGVNYRIITDHLGSPRFVINTTNGNIAQQIEYDEFGNVTSDTSPGFQPFGFAGGLYDRDSGLVRFGARDYDAGTGRWTAKDPILFKGMAINLYEYVHNNPLNSTDIFGLLCPVKPSGIDAYGTPDDKDKDGYPDYLEKDNFGGRFLWDLLKNEPMTREIRKNNLETNIDPESALANRAKRSEIVANTAQTHAAVLNMRQWLLDPFASISQEIGIMIGGYHKNNISEKSKKK